MSSCGDVFMASRGRGVQCYSSCPPSTVTIQPPPFAITIPGPSLYCANQPMAIQQRNPCVRYGGRGLGGKVRLSVTDGEEDLIEEVEPEEEDIRRWRGSRRPWGYGRRPGYGYGSYGPYGPYGRRPYGGYGPYGGGSYGYGPYSRGPYGYGPYGRGPGFETALED